MATLLNLVSKIILNEIPRTYPHTNHKPMTIVITMVIVLWSVLG